MKTVLQLIAPRLMANTALVLAIDFAAIVAASAGCPIDFEDLPVGTAITNQYPGVTFSVPRLACNPGIALFMRIGQSVDGTSSGSNCLRIDPGCPDLSDDYLVMVFDLPQTTVGFYLGEEAVAYNIRYYDAPTGGALLRTLTINCYAGVHQRVNVAATNIRRIEVESAEHGHFEAIDDLSFDAYGPPIAEITSPVFQACDCSDSVQVLGRSCVANGGYDHDTLEYMPAGGMTWLSAGSATLSACATNSFLYTWNSSGLIEGLYYLKLTVYNKCGQTSEAITMVNVDRTVGAVMRLPLKDMILGGTVCVDGSAGDGCFDHYTVQRTLPDGITFVPVDAGHSQYSLPVQNDPLASWDTTSAPDGNYKLRVTAYDPCGRTGTAEVKLTVDNTPPVANISSPVQCSKLHGVIPIFGTAFDAHFQSWALQYSSVNSHSWAPIATGSAPIVNGLLTNWDTSSLPQCAYAVRLVATDLSRVNLDCSTNSGAHETEYILTLDVVSDPLAQDTDADGMPDVWEIAHGFNPNDPSDATQDADNDGQSNLAEYLAGTDPRDPSSLLRITSIGREGTDMRVTWTTVGSHHYVVEEGRDLAAGIHSSVSPVISVSPGGAGTTNYLQLDGATMPRGFYRVHLVH